MRYEVFIVKPISGFGSSSQNALLSLYQYYTEQPGIPGNTRGVFDLYSDAELWIKNYGDNHLTFTILPVYKSY